MNQKKSQSVPNLKNGVSGTKLFEKASILAHAENPNWRRVFDLLCEAMRAGSADATYALGTWYLSGKEPVVGKDLRKAVELLASAADSGIPSAQYELAVCYQNGEGVRKSERRAFDLYLASALRGDSDALVEVARCLQHGTGIKRDRRTAKVFIERAAELGVEIA